MNDRIEEIRARRAEETRPKTITDLSLDGRSIDDVPDDEFARAETFDVIRLMRGGQCIGTMQSGPERGYYGAEDVDALISALDAANATIAERTRERDEASETAANHLDIGKCAANRALERAWSYRCGSEEPWPDGDSVRDAADVTAEHVYDTLVEGLDELFEDEIEAASEFVAKRLPMGRTTALVTDEVIADLEAERDALRAENARLRAAIADVHALIDESDGVYGLHRNGDPSPWSELLSGGQYEEWLASFSGVNRG